MNALRLSKVRSIGFKGLVVAAGLTIGGGHALGQYAAYTSDVTHNFVLTTGGYGTTWNSVLAKTFTHASVRDFWQPVGVGNWSPGQYPSDPPAQLPTFNRFGIEQIQTTQAASSVVSVCPWGYCNPPVVTPVNLKVRSVPPTGLPLTHQSSDVPMVARAIADSWVRVDPYSNNSPISGQIRSRSYYQVVGPPVRQQGRAFGYSEVRASRTIAPPPSPLTAVIAGIVWSVHLTIHAPVPPPGTGVPVQQWKGAWDPIYYTASDATGLGTTESGRIFSFTANALDGSIDWAEGALTMEGGYAEINITVDNPRVSPQGSLHLVVRDGVLTESAGSGFFAPMAPPVGLVAPFAMQVPADLNFNLDLTGIAPRRPLNLEIGMDGAGIQDQSNDIICVVDMDNGTGMGNPDGGVGIEDLLYFLEVYNAGTVAADVDDGSSTGHPDGGVGIEDLLFFLVRYNEGC